MVASSAAWYCQAHNREPKTTVQSNIIKTALPIDILRRPGVYTAREGTPAYTSISALLLTADG